jgi:hypothetical protein
MTINEWLMVGIFIIGAGSLIGFFITKTPGFGKYTTSALLLILVVTISALLYVGGKIEGETMANIIFAVFGFAGGLFTGKNGS